MLSSPSFKLAVLGPALLIAGCNKQTGDSAQPPAAASSAAPAADAPKLEGTLDRSQKGGELPDITVKTQDGKTLKLTSLKGKPVLLNLWATWCVPCVVELPMLDKVAAERGAALKVLTISQDSEQTEKVAPFLAGRGIKHLEPWLDPKTDLAVHYNASTMPTTILYDAQGREVWRYVGGHDWSSEAARKLIDEAVG